MKSQKGFTLVELAIAMIIVGLLIGGVLKGKELVVNSRVTATIAQAKATTAGMSTFKDMYRHLPGDLPTPLTFIPNCTNRCLQSNPALAGNGRIEAPFNMLVQNIGYGAAFNNGPRTEDLVFWQHLSFANLISGFNHETDLFLKTALPSGVFHPGYHPGFALDNIRPGHYLQIGQQTSSGFNGFLFDAGMASRIDVKMDDGMPYSGQVLTTSVGSPTPNCTHMVNGMRVYQEVLTTATCPLYISLIK